MEDERVDRKRARLFEDLRQGWSKLRGPCPGRMGAPLERPPPDGRTCTGRQIRLLRRGSGDGADRSRRRSTRPTERWPAGGGQSSKAAGVLPGCSDRRGGARGRRRGGRPGGGAISKVAGLLRVVLWRLPSLERIRKKLRERRRGAAAAGVARGREELHSRCGWRRQGGSTKR